MSMKSTTQLQWAFDEIKQLTHEMEYILERVQ